MKNNISGCYTQAVQQSTCKIWSYLRDMTKRRNCGVFLGRHQHCRHLQVAAELDVAVEWRGREAERVWGGPANHDSFILIHSLPSFLPALRKNVWRAREEQKESDGMGIGKLARKWRQKRPKISDVEATYTRSPMGNADFELSSLAHPHISLQGHPD